MVLIVIHQYLTLVIVIVIVIVRVLSYISCITLGGATHQLLNVKPIINQDSQWNVNTINFHRFFPYILRYIYQNPVKILRISGINSTSVRNHL
jgi:hypothetical protein